MNYDDLNLRHKTFLDFTTDERIIAEIIGDKEFFLSHVTAENRAMTFLDFADLTPDEMLAKAIRKEFAPELAVLFPE